ncbi:MAG TPA: CrcB family protein [Crocinitomicaceae bacterium]|nr:CrcB family protein [Crocinitomicaceae bacterium]
MSWLAVFLGGGIGSLMHFGIGKIPFTNQFPLNTLISNIVACFLLGTIVYSVKPQGNWQLFLTVGICGGLSTFSTFSKETFDLFQSGNYAIALANILISVMACLGIFWLVKG